MRYILPLLLLIAGCTNHLPEPATDTAADVSPHDHAAAAYAATHTQIWDGYYRNLHIAADHCTVIHRTENANYTFNGTFDLKIKHNFYSLFTVIPDAGYTVEGYDGEWSFSGNEFTSFADDDHTITIILKPSSAG